MRWRELGLPLKQGNFIDAPCRDVRTARLVISSGARDLAVLATYEKKISRLRLEMTTARQSPKKRPVERKKRARD